MTVACPCCRAANDAGPACRRCKADLALLFRVEAERILRLSEAARNAARGRFPSALEHLARAAAPRGGEDVRRLRAAVLLLSRDFAAARAAHAGPTAVAGTP